MLYHCLASRLLPKGTATGMPRGPWLHLHALGRPPSLSLKLTPAPPPRGPRPLAALPAYTPAALPASSSASAAPVWLPWR